MDNSDRSPVSSSSSCSVSFAGGSSTVPVSRPVIHREDVRSPADAAPRDTRWAVTVRWARLIQAVCSASALYTMWVTGDFHGVSVFRYFLAVVLIQCVWSVILRATDFQPQQCLYTGLLWRVMIGDGLIAALLFVGSAMCFGMVLELAEDLHACARTHCVHFGASAVLTFISYVAFFPTFFHSFRTLVSQSS